MDAQAPSPQGDLVETQATVADQFEHIAGLLLDSDEDQPDKDEQQDPAKPEGDEPEPEADTEPDADVDDEDAEPEGDTDELEEEPKPAADKLYPVTLPGGKKEMVTLTELQQGYSRTADYTRKTQADAEKRKNLDAEYTGVRESRARYIALLEQAELAVKAMAPENEPDWAEMRKTLSADEVLEAQENHRQYTKRLTVIRDTIEKQRQDDFADSQKHAEQAAELESQRLLEAVPEWRDSAKLEVGLKRVVDYARSLGFNDKQLRMVSDHRLVVLIDKARRWDALRAGKPQGGNLRKPGVRTAVPGTPAGRKPDSNRVARERATANLRKSGRQADAAAVFEASLKLD